MTCLLTAKWYYNAANTINANNLYFRGSKAFERFFATKCWYKQLILTIFAMISVSFYRGYLLEIRKGILDIMKVYFNHRNKKLFNRIFF